MPSTTLWAAALSLLLSNNESGCQKSALQAADLLDRLADDPDIDCDTRTLCQRASDQLAKTSYRV